MKPSRPRSAGSRSGIGLPEKIYTADQVFAAAVQAQLQNGKYVKFPEYDLATGDPIRQTNRSLMVNMLLNQTVFSVEQIQRGRQVRQHFQGYLLQEIAGTLKQFGSSALRVSSKDQFSSNDILDLSIIAALPDCAERDQRRQSDEDERRRAAATSQLVGRPGDRITGEFEIVTSVWSQRWNCWTVNAISNGNLFFMFLNKNIPAGTLVKLSGTVKSHRDDNITQLHRVRLHK
jgi:hypothetical protein